MMENKELINGIRENIRDRQDLIHEIRMYRLMEDETIKVATDAYNEYLEGIKIRDITSHEQAALGMTVLHVLAEKETDFALHQHERQSQTVSVVTGKILDLENRILFSQGESFFVSRKFAHRLRYYDDTQLLIVYMPALEQVKPH
jgi:hypothetical protein